MKLVLSMNRKTSIALGITTMIIIIATTYITFSSDPVFSLSTLSVSGTPDTFSTTGPDAPSMPSSNRVSPAQLTILSIADDSKVLNVPQYFWRHGCGPTAIGMLLGYYDENYHTNYITNLDSIASTEHYHDYSEPIDNTAPEPIPDKSETGTPHLDNCVADVLMTSVSRIELKYGWSYTRDIAPTISGYSGQHGLRIDAYYYDSFTLNDLKKEIDSGRPFLVFMNADGIGGADHFATCSGYNSDNLIIQTTWESQPVIETPLLGSSEQFGLDGVVFTSNPITGDNNFNSTPAFELLSFIICLGIIVVYMRYKK